ncbi:MAG TPA: hypothetical protein VNN22_01710 [Verrucomicrobiae bacterium]|nr:hypothetical protein [Verrucomicrobiae bacterium]
METEAEKEERDFSGLSTEELVPCCLWEYARESERIREIVRRIKALDEGIRGISTKDLSLSIGAEAVELRELLLRKSAAIQLVDSEASSQQALSMIKEMRRFKKRIEEQTKAARDPIVERIGRIDKAFDELEADGRRLMETVSGKDAQFGVKDLKDVEKSLAELKARLAQFKREESTETESGRTWFLALLNERARVVYLAIAGHHFSPPLPFPACWRSLPPSARSRLSEFWPLEKSRKSGKDAWVLSRPDPVCEGAFAESLGQNSDECPGTALENQVTFGTFQIKWDYGDDDIVTAFRHWLKSKRPPFSCPTDRRGHDLDHYRAALRRLGIMRRIHADPSQANAEWNKEARRALTHFREFTGGLLAAPQLPGDTEREEPLHWPASLGR